MVKQLIEGLETLDVRPTQWFLTLLCIILIRLHVEILFLQYHRSVQFVAINIFYFLSLILSISLIIKIITGHEITRILRIALPVSLVFLVPLLDIFFYPHLKGDALLATMPLPIFRDMEGYAIYLAREFLAFGFVLERQASLGLRLEIAIVNILIIFYVVSKARSLVSMVLKGILAHLLSLSTICVHIILVLHPFTREWIFPPLVLLELLACEACRAPGAAIALLRHVSWRAVLLISAGIIFGYCMKIAALANIAPHHGATMATLAIILSFGLFAGAAIPGKHTDGEWKMRPQAKLFAPVFCLLASYVMHPYLFLSFAVLLALVYLCSLSPFTFTRNIVFCSVMAALALWLSSWAGQIIPTLGFDPVESKQFIEMVAKTAGEENPVVQGKVGDYDVRIWEARMDNLQLWPRWLYSPLWTTLPFAFSGVLLLRNYFGRFRKVS